MLKATLKSAVLLGLLAAMGAPVAQAEVQNVRVGGDITVRGFYRDNLDLHGEDGDGQAYFNSTVGLNVGADLTENVSAFIRLANERDWNVDGAATGDFDLSQAYITLNEVFYSPLTLRIGTQPIVWGRGFVLGSSLIPTIALRPGDRNASIAADEFTDFTNFDAVRATLDLSGTAALDMPLTLDYVYIKIDENVLGLSDDVNLQGVNLSTRFDDMNGEMEMYYLNKRDKGVAAPGDNGSVNTLGLRGSAEPVEGAYVYAEAAYQFGKRGLDPNGVLVAGNPHQAWAFNLGADYTFVDMEMMPKIGAEWIYFSGKDNGGAVSGWDPIARGYFTTALREFQNVVFNAPDQTCLSAGGFGNTCTGSYTNQHQLSLYGSLKPIEDLTVDQRISWFINDVGVRPTAGTAGTQMNGDRKNFAGTEWDTVLTYDYTDDVQLGLIYAVYFPGSVYRDPNNDTAQELISSVSVKF